MSFAPCGIFICTFRSPRAGAEVLLWVLNHNPEIDERQRPRCGLSELLLQTYWAGSSIMQATDETKISR
jgi:hypothetical protein